MSRQIHLTRAQPGATGNVFFSMKALLRNSGGMADRLQQLYAVPALLPASPWLDDEPPAPPRLTLERRRRRAMQVQITPGSAERGASWLVQARYGLLWDLRILPTSETSLRLPARHRGETCSLIAVRAVDRNGNLSTAAVLQ